MTDQTDAEFDAMDDLELITTYLNDQLPPARVDAIKRRLKDDAAFLDLAEPLILAWSVSPHIKRKPRPEGELERDWAEFVKRTGFPLRPADPPASAAPPARPRPRRPSWLRWLAILVLGVAGVAVITLLAQRRAAVVIPPVASDSTSTLVPYDTGWIAVMDGIEVQLTPGASPTDGCAACGTRCSRARRASGSRTSTAP